MAIASHLNSLTIDKICPCMDMLSIVILEYLRVRVTFA
jgi:hypothetical protein